MAHIVMILIGDIGYDGRVRKEIRTLVAHGHRVELVVSDFSTNGGAGQDREPRRSRRLLHRRRAAEVGGAALRRQRRLHSHRRAFRTPALEQGAGPSPALPRRVRACK